jgi:hypothetical protein
LRAAKSEKEKKLIFGRYWQNCNELTRKWKINTLVNNEINNDNWLMIVHKS